MQIRHPESFEHGFAFKRGSVDVIAEGWKRVSFFLPGFIIPGLLLYFAWTTALTGWWIALFIFIAIQILYALTIEWLRRERDLSPSIAFERGDRKAKRCVVLVHGFADTPLAWSRQADVLAQRGWRVLVPELDLSATSESWLTAIRSALCEAKTGADYVELWGHSMGAALATTVAQTVSVHRLVLWAPFLEPAMGRLASRFFYLCHRLFLWWPYTLTWFPVARYGKGEPETFYRVRRVIPTRTFTSALAVPKQTLQKQPDVPTVIILSQHDTVVRNTPVRRFFTDATFLLAASPRSSHALTNAADWLLNLNRLLEGTDETCDPL